MGGGWDKSFRKARFVLEYLAVMLPSSLVRLLPFPLMLRLGGALGRLAYLADKRHRDITIDNLRKSFAGKTDDEIRNIARGVYRNLGYSVVELIHSGGFKGRFDGHVSVKNYEAYQRALDKGRGILLLTGHCGNWELLAMAQGIRKPPIGIVVRPLDNPYLDRAVSRLRIRYGNVLINKRSGLKDILRFLEGGVAVGILLDQNVAAHSGVFVDFFGRPACTNKALALIAARTKAPVIPAFIRRVGLDSHEITIGDEIPLISTGDKEADVTANTQAYTRAIEEFIRENPDQWFWMHRRWKTRPEGSNNVGKNISKDHQLAG